jgi:hypothetical protein
MLVTRFSGVAGCCTRRCLHRRQWMEVTGMDGRYAAERVGGVPDRPSPARVYDWFLGGSYNYPVDRALAAKAAALLPELPQMLRANRAFLQRAVQYIAGCRVCQFVDLGSGLPTVGNVHTAARAIAPGARVVYVDVDPAVAEWSAAIVGADPNTGVACADLPDPDAVLASAAVQRLIDWSQPVGVLAVAVAHFIPDTAALRAAFDRYRDVAVAGSYLALSHGNVAASPGAAPKMGTCAAGPARRWSPAAGRAHPDGGGVGHRGPGGGSHLAMAAPAQRLRVRRRRPVHSRAGCSQTVIATDGHVPARCRGPG